MAKFQTIFIDFDSTFTQVEALDELANLVLENHDDKEIKLQQIHDLTLRAMQGELAFDKALEQRLALLSFTKEHLEHLIEILRTKISISFERNKSYFQENAESIYIISGGFREFICPIVAEFSIPEHHVYANEFCWNEAGQCIGFDTNNVLSQPQGKVHCVNQLNLPKPSCIIGDGYTDYELKKEGAVDAFFLFTENITRENLLSLANYQIASFDEFLIHN